jgi:hypothetical protein
MKEKNDNIRSDIELLEAYLAGTLPGQEKKVVEERLLSDQEFINLYDTLKTLPQAARRSHLESKRDQLLELEERLRQAEESGLTPFRDGAAEQSGQTPFTVSDEAFGEGPRAGTAGESISEKGEKLDDAPLHQDSSNVQSSALPRKVIRRWWMGVAAGVVILMGALFFMTDRRTEGSAGRQYVLDHFEQFILHDKSRGAGTEIQAEIDKRGYDLFVVQDFLSAIPILRSNWELASDTMSYFYLGLALMAKDESEESIQVLTSNSLKNYNGIDQDLIKDLLQAKKK